MSEEFDYKNFLKENEASKKKFVKSQISSFPKGDFYLQYKHIDGKQHSTKIPIFVHYRNDGTKSSESWYLHNKRHRENDYSLIAYHKNGTICGKFWYSHGLNVNSEKPAIVYYREDGTKYSEYWYISKMIQYNHDGSGCYQNDAKSARVAYKTS